MARRRLIDDLGASDGGAELAPDVVDDSWHRCLHLGIRLVERPVIAPPRIVHVEVV